MFTHSATAPATEQEEPKAFYFIGNRMLVELHDEEAVLPAGLRVPLSPEHAVELPGIGVIEVVRDLFLGTLDNVPCRAVELRQLAETESSPQGSSSGTVGRVSARDALALMGLRSLMGRMDEELLKVAGVASQVLDWDRNHQFCGRCGTKTVPSATERSRKCPNCSLTAYPRISPAIIVAVTKGDRILLGHNRRHRVGHVFSVLAGFVEPGESLEECVRREIMEEVGIEVDEIKYFASQPWPFPDSLMIAFTASHKAGEIRVDGSEIVEADWFDKDHLPNIPPHGTVARRLIDWFTESQRGTEGGSR